MKRLLLLLLIVMLISQTVFAQTVIVGGNTIGLQLGIDGVSVVEFTEQLPEQAGLKRGDIIIKIDGRPITNAASLKEAVQKSDGKLLSLTVQRDKEQKTIKLAPTKTAQGWQLGVLVRDTIHGIGTVTYYDPETGCFGALGHGVSDGKQLLPIAEGAVLPSTVAAVERGECGIPGALHGAICGRITIGEISGNTPQGIFGIIEEPMGQPMETASVTQAHTGKAVILSNVQGTKVEEFSVKICAIYPKDRADRNFLIEVTDSNLLNMTGGIVQGMSGSPIIQDGKLIGAVTHVLIDDPTHGYGIAIERMLTAAQQAA